MRAKFIKLPPLHIFVGRFGNNRNNIKPGEWLSKTKSLTIILLVTIDIQYVLF